MRTSLIALAAALLAAPAIAEEGASDRPSAGDASSELVVTGVRQAYRGEFAPREAPQSIGEIDSAAIEDAGALRLPEALDLVASVSRQNNLGGFFDAFAVRGFAGDENFPSNYLVNGFNGGRGFGGVRDTAGIERIEVLRGPTAALYGRGEPGGTVNLVTKQAELGRLFGAATLQIGSFDRYRGDLDANLPLGESVAVRLIGYAEEAGSFRNRPDSDRRGFLPSVTVRLGPDTTARYDLEWTQTRAPFDRGTIAPDGQFDFVSRRLFLGEPGDGRHVADVVGHQLQLEHRLSGAWSLLIGGSYRETSLEGFSSDPELVRSRQRLYQDGRSLSRQRRSRDYDAEHLVLRGELAGDVELGGMRHRVLLGIDFDDYQNDQVFRRFRPPAVSGNPTAQAGYVLDLLNPVYGRFPLPTPGPLTDRLDEQRAVGFYLQDQITLSDRFAVRFGGRYDSYNLRSLNRLNADADERDYQRFSPQFGIVFTATPHLSLYAAYGEGFRPNLAADAAGNLFDPETSRSYELGAKFGLLDDAIQGTVALFSMNKRNVLAADPINPGFSTTIGAARSQGLEFDLTGQLPGNVDVILSYAYMDAESRANVLDPNFGLQIRTGDPLLNIPRHTLAAQIAKTVEAGGTSLRFGAGVQHSGRRLGETATTFFLPSHTLVRVFAEWTVSENVEAFVTINNLFNETWYANSFATLFLQPGTPRDSTVGVRLRF
ncbi:TonB-dependent siderophore receptor [Sphingomonas lacunae]|uniref:TonB-dependent siderophore receptor n=1 Tax=Sphingomonas lacunae TaxID=2698828 RepID=A0A6M4ASX4_9SPHN|nr:TonB-dependent siderophore receptor [Sphingomonas lacunae]QJQ31169.1 TonB-dependent siderophore receptor [Sphingomonas lacunae]